MSEHSRGFETAAAFSGISMGESSGPKRAAGSASLHGVGDCAVLVRHQRPPRRACVFRFNLTRLPAHTGGGTTMKVGFIGLGTMGASMASNLRKAGYEMTVNDLRRDAAGPHLEAGAKWVASAREVAAASDVVFTSLPGPKEAEAVGDEMLDAMKQGSAWFDLSTNSPTVVRRIHAKYAAKGIA